MLQIIVDIKSGLAYKPSEFKECKFCGEQTIDKDVCSKCELLISALMHRRH